MLAGFQAVVQGGSHGAEGEKWSHFAGVLDVGGQEDESEGSGAEQLEGWSFHSHLLPLAAVTRPHRLSRSPGRLLLSPTSIGVLGFCCITRSLPSPSYGLLPMCLCPNVPLLKRTPVMLD